MWSQYTGHCQVFGIHMNYYMLLYTSVQYTYAHFHLSIATVLAFLQMYVLSQLYEVMICISIDVSTKCFGKPILTPSCVWIVTALVIFVHNFTQPALILVL